MARSRYDASDETREGAEARRIKRSLINPDRALEQRRATDAVSKADRHKETRPVREAEGKADYVWVDRGVVDTKLSRIDRKEYAGVWEDQKTHKFSKDEIDASLKRLPEVRSRLGKGTSRDELRALVWSSDTKERQVGRTYKSYYESDPIKVDFTADGRSTVASGRHRLARADHLGMDDLPIRISEQTRRKKEEDRC